MPIARVQTPQGIARLDVPEGTTPEQIEAFVASNFQQQQQQQQEAPPQEPGFFGRIGEDIAQREANIQELRQFDQTGFERGLQTAGQTAALVGDIAGEAIGQVGRGISAITSDRIKEPLREAGGEALESPVVQAGLQALQAGGQAYERFKAANPRIARNLEASVNVGLLAAPVGRGVPKPPASQTILGRVGERVGEAAQKQVQERKSGFATELVEPKITPTIGAERIKRTREAESLFGQRTIDLPFSEQRSIEEVSKLPISSKKTLLGNLNVIQDEIVKEANDLQKALSKNNVVFPRKEFNARLESAKADLAKSPLLTGDAEKSAQRVLSKFDEILAAKPSNALGLLEARKELDRFLEKQGGPKVLESEGRQTAIKEAVRTIRQTTNSFIDEKSTNVAVRDSLSKQSALFNAVDNIAPKAAAEGANRFERLLNTVKANANKLGISGSIFTTGALGAAALSGLFTPAAFIGGTYIAGKGALRGLQSPKTKQGVSNLLKVTDKAIRTSKDKDLVDLVRQLRLDRAALLSVLNGEGEEE